MRKLLVLAIAAVCVPFGFMSPAHAVSSYTTTATVGDCPSAVFAFLVPTVAAESPLQLAIGVEAGRAEESGGQCLSLHAIVVSASLWLVAPTSPETPVAELLTVAGRCNPTKCAREQGFGAATVPPGVYRVKATITLDGGTPVNLETVRFLYNGRDLSAI